MRTTLTVDVQYNPRVTDPESLAVALDRLLEIALSTPEILDDYGNPVVGEFFVLQKPRSRRRPIWVRRMDWALLRKQKAWLASQQTEEAEGLLALLDSLQDFAVGEWGVPEGRVFPAAARSLTQ
jgi:hypothetical protein